MIRHPASSFWYMGAVVFIVSGLVWALLMAVVVLFGAAGKEPFPWRGLFVPIGTFLGIGILVALLACLAGFAIDTGNTVWWRTPYRKLRRQGFTKVPKEWGFCLGPSLIERPCDDDRDVVWLLNHPNIGVLVAPSRLIAEQAAEEYGGRAYWKRRYR